MLPRYLLAPQLTADSGRRAALQFGATALVAFVSAYVVASGEMGLLLLSILAGVMLVALLSPAAIVAATLLAFATTTVTRDFAVSLGPFTIYPIEFWILLLCFRALLPRERAPSPHALRGLPRVAFATLALIMLLAGLRGYEAGTPLDDLIRREAALVYYPSLIFALSRIIREREMVIRSLWRDLAIVALALVGWMLLMRALGRSFEPPGGEALGKVITSTGDVVRRDYGSASAFIVYPVLALVATAGLAYGASMKLKWTLLAGTGLGATLLTLIRGEIYGLVIGTLVILALRLGPRIQTARLRTAAVLVGLALILGGATALVAPEVGRAVVERSLSGLVKESEQATVNREYRVTSVVAGIETARAHPAGLGVVDAERLQAEGLHHGYLVHSGFAALLIYGGWPALAAAVVLVLALLRRSAVLAAPTPWLHPAFVGVLTMLLVFSFTVLGVAGEQWVVGVTALAIAVRFNVDFEPQPVGTGRASTAATRR